MTSRARLRRAGLLAIATAAAISLAGCSLLGSAFGGDTTARDDDGQVVEQNDAADVFTIRVGDCLNDASAGDEVTEVPLVPCSEPHDSEVFASIIMTGDAFPGNDAVIAEADDACFERFEEFVGIPYVDSIYDFSYYFPTEGSWAGGDREILCVIYDPAGQKLTGSLEGIGR
ncbi:MAG: septum formation family protein [Microcella sp.]